MVQDIIDNGSVTNKPYLGVPAGTVNMQMSQQAGLSQGVCLYAVDPNGAAAAAGCRWAISSHKSTGLLYIP